MFADSDDVSRGDESRVDDVFTVHDEAKAVKFAKKEADDSGLMGNFLSSTEDLNPDTVYIIKEAYGRIRSRRSIQLVMSNQELREAVDEILDKLPKLIVDTNGKSGEKKLRKKLRVYASKLLEAVGVHVPRALKKMPDRARVSLADSSSSFTRKSDYAVGGPKSVGGAGVARDGFGFERYASRSIGGASGQVQVNATAKRMPLASTSVIRFASIKESLVGTEVSGKVVALDYPSGSFGGMPGSVYSGPLAEDPNNVSRDRPAAALDEHQSAAIPGHVYGTQLRRPNSL